LLRRLKHDIRSDINADIDVHFTRLIKPDVPD
jgi:hypothetical protein